MQYPDSIDLCAIKPHFTPMPKRRPTPREARKVKDILDAFEVPEKFRGKPAPAKKREFGIEEPAPARAKPGKPAKPTPAKRPAHRPTLYCEPVIEEICYRLGIGESLVTICESDGLPAYRTVMTWLATRPDFQQRYACAREISADKLAGEVVEIADTSTPENAAAVRNRIDARKWVAGKLKPKVYGERITQDINANVAVTMTPEQRQARLTELEKRRQRRELLGGAV
jgi:hypothetical protein